MLNGARQRPVRAARLEIQGQPRPPVRGCFRPSPCIRPAFSKHCIQNALTDVGSLVNSPRLSAKRRLMPEAVAVWKQFTTLVSIIA